MSAPRTTSPAALADPAPHRPARAGYQAELDQLRLQVEVMGVRVDENLERMRVVLEQGEERQATLAVNADDDIDAMQVSLTERCYELLAREQPVASDLRLIVSVVRLIAELERIGDLSLRVVKLWPDHDVLAGSPATFDLLLALADLGVDRYRLALRAFATSSLELAGEVSQGSPEADHLTERLYAEIQRLRGEDAVPVAVKTMTAGQALHRIVDHTAVLGARLRYLFTGDPNHLAAEVR
jgi:phosphate transport system protein